MTDTLNMSAANVMPCGKAAATTKCHSDNETIYLAFEGRLLRDCISAVLQKPNRVIESDCLNLDELSARIDVLAPPDLVMVSLAVSELASAFTRIRATRTHWPHTRWIVLSRFADREFIRNGLKSGVDGFLLEDSPGEVLRLVIDLVLLGHSPLPSGVARMLAEEAAARRPIEIERTVPVVTRSAEIARSCAESPMALARRSRELSGREQDILRCLSQGKSNKVIARELMIAEATVKAHVKALLRKMQVSNRTQAAICATEVLGPVAQQAPSLLTFNSPAPAVGRPSAMHHRAEHQRAAGL